MNEGRQYTLLDMKRSSVLAIGHASKSSLSVGRRRWVSAKHDGWWYDNDIIIVDMGFCSRIRLPWYPTTSPLISRGWWSTKTDSRRGFLPRSSDHIGRFGISYRRYRTGLATKFYHRHAPEKHGRSKLIVLSYVYRDQPPKRTSVQVGDSFNIEPIRVNHSIPDVAAVVNAPQSATC